MSEEKNDLVLKGTPELRDLNALERKAVEMKYLGKQYAEIAVATDYSESHIKKLFMSGGRLTKAYEQFAAMQGGKAHENVALALNLAKQEAVNAIERIIALSKEAETEGGIFKANEFLLQIAGVTETVALRNFFLNTPFDRAHKIVEDLFKSIYGRSLTPVMVMPTVKLYGGREAEFNIGGNTSAPAGEVHQLPPPTPGNPGEGEGQNAQ